MVRGPKKHMKRLNAPSHWMLDKLGGIFVSLLSGMLAARLSLLLGRAATAAEMIQLRRPAGA
jgi:ribosomal protein S4E